MSDQAVQKDSEAIDDSSPEVREEEIIEAKEPYSEEKNH